MMLNEKNIDLATQVALAAFEEADKLQDALRSLTPGIPGDLQTAVGKVQSIVGSGRDRLFEDVVLRDLADLSAELSSELESEKRTESIYDEGAVRSYFRTCLTKRGERIAVALSAANGLQEALKKMHNLMNVVRIVGALGEDGTRRSA